MSRTLLKQINFTFLILWILGCNFPDNSPSFPKNNINSVKGNWLVNLDSLKSIDNYITTYRTLSDNSDSALIPFIITNSNQQINLRQIRKPKGSGYFWDCRSQFKIHINSNKVYSCYWRTGASCNSIDLTEHVNHFTSLKNLKNEIKNFYKTNTDLELSQEPTKSELEIWIIPMDDDLINCKAIIENAANAYQEFLIANKNRNIPLSIVLSKNTVN